MKKLFLLLLLTWCFCTGLKAQSIVTSPVGSKYTDSLLKYNDITDYYLELPQSKRIDSLIEYYHKKGQFFSDMDEAYRKYNQHMADSLRCVEIKQKLETKYKIKLP